MEERQYEHLVEHFPEGILIFEEKRCSFINETGVKLLCGDRKDQFLGKSIYELIPENHHERLERRLSRITDRKPMGPAEEQFICLDGDILDVEVRVLSPVSEKNGRLHVVFRDIGQRKKAEAFLLNSEKLTVTGQLAAEVAHGMAYSLTVLKGFFQLMENEIKEKKPYLDVIFSEINRMEIILTELKVLAEPQEAKMERAHVDKILNEVGTLFKARRGASDVKLKWRIEDGLPQILCDVNQLKQVFIQLMKNGAEAMPEGGKLMIQAERHTSDKLIIHFIDEGCGISDEQLKRLGEPFFTTKKHATGLGLMVAYRIIENHNGSIRVASNPHGTTVGVILPFAKG